MSSPPIKSLFPSKYPHVHNSPHSPFYPPLFTPKAHIYHNALGSIFSLPHLPDVPTSNAVCDSYNPTDDECQPGNRVIDLFADRIHLHLEHPPKKADDDAIHKWIRTSLQPRINQAHNDPNTIVIYTDGSASQDGTNSSSGFVAYYPEWTTLTEQAKWAGRGFSFDAELIAIMDSLTYLISNSLASYHLHIFTDSESVAKALFKTKSGRQQLISVNSTLRKWFLLSERNHLHISYCPSHMGVEGNERVDRLIADIGPPPQASPSSFTSFSFEKRRITVDTIDAWTASTVKLNPSTGRSEPDPSYWGHDYLHSPSTHTFNPALAGLIIRRLGKHSIITSSRVTRVINNHNFTGAYRAKFRPLAEEPTACTCGHFPRGSPLHDRHHVLFECPLYYRGEMTTLEHLLDLDPFPKIQSFLALNPGAFTIQDAPADTTDWADDEIDPRLELLINLIGDLALRHESVRACLPIPNCDVADLSPSAAVHLFKCSAHTRVFNDTLLPLLELAHEFKQESRYRRSIKALHSRGHRYPITNDQFLILRRRLLRTRPKRKSRHHFNRHSIDNAVLCYAPRDLSPPSPTLSISDISTFSFPD